MTAPTVLDPGQCQAALQQVLQSHAFARSEQARKFLKFVCEKAVLGQAEDIKEYSIGVEALGRPPDYSPADDSSVRRRAYEIRQRLDEFYSTEMPDARIRIELPKGSYVPAFVEWPPEPPATPRTENAAVVPPASRRWLALLAAMAAGVLLGGGSMLAIRGWRMSAHPGVDPIVAEFWGPLLSPHSSTLICLGSGLYMTVRSAAFPTDINLPSFQVPQELYAGYRQYHPLPNEAHLYMRPVDNVAPIGMISGVAVATGIIKLAGAAYEVLPERTAPLASFRGRNVILFGDGLTSFAAARELGQAYFTIGYDSSGTKLVIRDRRKPPSDPPAFSRKPESASGTLEAYGLITALPSEGSSAGSERTFVISGVSNAGVHGAMEFLTSPERLQNLKERFLRGGLHGIPVIYQVVVRCSASNSLLLTYEYATHEVIDPRLARGLRRE